jgi:hypothetical protein
MQTARENIWGKGGLRCRSFNNPYSPLYPPAMRGERNGEDVSRGERKSRKKHEHPKNKPSQKIKE